MAIDTKPCTICTFWDGHRCTQTWRVMFFIKPTGGIVEFMTTPGMVPEHLKVRLTEFMSKFMEKLAPAIEAIPIWNEIREWQLAHQDRGACPGRQVMKGIPHLHVVPREKLEMDLGGRKV